MRMTLNKRELGNKIKEARELKSKKINKKYTGQMLADDIGISRGYLGDIESGRIYPNYELLTKIAEACEVPLSFFENNEKNEEMERLANKEIKSVEDALEIIKYQDGLMLNGKILTDEDKMLLANALQLGMKYVLEQEEKRRKKGEKKNK